MPVSYISSCPYHLALVPSLHPSPLYFHVTIFEASCFQSISTHYLRPQSLLFLRPLSWMKKIWETITTFCKATRNITVNPGWNASLWTDYSAPTPPCRIFCHVSNKGSLLYLKFNITEHLSSFIMKMQCYYFHPGVVCISKGIQISPVNLEDIEG